MRCNMDKHIMPKQQLISDIIEEYRENYKLKTGKYPQTVPLKQKEFNDMVFIIRKFIIEHPEQESYYYLEGIDDEEPILVWKNSEIYINPESANLRASILP